MTWGIVLIVSVAVLSFAGALLNRLDKADRTPVYAFTDEEFETWMRRMDREILAQDRWER